MQRQCSECGEFISPKRIEAMPNTRICVDCALDGTDPPTIGPPKPIATKPIVTTHGMRRYLANVGQKTDAGSLFRTMVRLSYLFPHVSATEMTAVFVQWCQRTASPFDHQRVHQMVLDAKKRVLDRPNRRT
ncbi:MAG: TraR/DksA C4-type zinc finger protein [Polyangiaceae bacterium]